MKKPILILIIIAASFFSGFAFRTILPQEHTEKRVTGIGGIFFKCKDPKKVREWYRVHLGLTTNN